MVGFSLKNTLSESGSVSRGICTTDSESHLLKVEEHSNIRKEGGKILGENLKGIEHELKPSTATSMNMWGFTSDYLDESEVLFREFLKQNIDEPKKEFYVPSVVSTMIQEGKAEVKVLETPSTWFGVTYKEDRPKVVAKLKEMAENGTYPSPLF